MDNRTITNGWERLPSGYDVEFTDNVPVRISDNGSQSPIPGTALIEQIKALTALQVRLGEWEPGEQQNEHEARLYVSDKQFADVLQRLALSSAAVFFDRFRKAVDKDDVDWDRMEYLKDFRTALEHCGLRWGDVDQDTFLADYGETMHQETRRLMQAAKMPPVEPELP